MHLMMILAALSCAWYLRCKYFQSVGNWTQRWEETLKLFLFPPLVLMMTTISVLCMGPSGQMLGMCDGWTSYFIAIGFLGWIIGRCLILTVKGYLLVEKIRAYPQMKFAGKTVRILDTTALFTAQVGFYHPELVVSQGLLDALDDAHLQAVFAHEEGHYYYRDTFWFFWLGCLRDLTVWLPNSEALYSELLTLRELRADRWAATQVDSLLLAEALVQVVNCPTLMPSVVCATFSYPVPKSRLLERIDALLVEPEDSLPFRWCYSWTWLLWAFTPLLTLPFHT